MLKKEEKEVKCVSIQLMSPASGDKNTVFAGESRLFVSIQLMSPASGDSQAIHGLPSPLPVSIQLMSPASGDI